MGGEEGKGGAQTASGASTGAGTPAFNEPRLAINRVYTRHGDGDATRLVGGQLVPKNDARIDTYGTVDELNSFIGAARQSIIESLRAAPPEGRGALSELCESLLRVQHELFNLGSILATLPEDVHPRQPRVTDAEVKLLEAEMDRCQEQLAPLRSFVLPGGSRANTDLHVARTVCRRAERLCVELARAAEIDMMAITYLNRLSDALFVWSRWVSMLLGVEEILWEPNRSASGKTAERVVSGPGSTESSS